MTGDRGLAKKIAQPREARVQLIGTQHVDLDRARPALPFELLHRAQVIDLRGLDVPARSRQMHLLIVQPFQALEPRHRLPQRDEKARGRRTVRPSLVPLQPQRVHARCVRPFRSIAVQRHAMVVMHPWTPCCTEKRGNRV
eukprot:scaffold7772_cov141-Isochrysis_galbana.AAC.4